MDETAKRIFLLLKEKGIDQKEFAVLIGTTDKTVSTWSTGRTKSYRKYILQIASVLETTVDYLLTGRKEKPAPQDEGGLSEVKKVFIAKVALLDDKTVQVLNDVADRVLAQQEK